MANLLDNSQILSLIPQSFPFRFVDEIEYADEQISKGSYYFKKDEYFYQGHFPDIAITPSVILTEAMAQIGLIPLGILNFIKETSTIDRDNLKPIFTNADVKFVRPVFPETKVIVEAEKIYFRLNRLKAKVKLMDSDNNLCASGTLSGIILTDKSIQF